MNFETAKIFIDKILNKSPDYSNYIDYNKKGCTLEFIGGEAFL